MITFRLGFGAPMRVLLVGAILTTGCMAESHSQGGDAFRPRPAPRCPVPSASAETATIDTNDTNTISSAPGEGIGVLVDYDTGGHWHVWTVCDTSISNFACAFDVTAQVLGGDVVTSVTGENLESGESAGLACPDTAYLSSTTDLGIDGVRFTTTPGASVQITGAVDGTVFPDIVFWAFQGAAQASTTNPVTLTPASP
jgi:hypothetical protein